MSELIMNATPVRTSKNFNINDIKLSDIVLPSIVYDFSNVSIKNESPEIVVTDNVSEFELKYGVSKFLLDEIKNKSNKKIKIDASCKQNEELQLAFNMDNRNNYLLENIEIEANKNSKSTVIIKYVNDDTKASNAFIHNGLLRVNAKEDSEINVILLNMLGYGVNNLVSIENTMLDNSRINFTIVDFGGKTSVSNYYSNIIGKNADNKLNTIYLGNEEQFFDLNYIANLRGEKSNVNIEVQGALADNAKKHFKGTIDFKKGCKKAIGNENEYCVLLSDKAKSISLPMLLCSEEDVVGNHSSSAGKIGESELFYITSRGFEKKEAMKLIIRANFNKILENIKSEEILEEINREIDKKLD